MGKDTIGMNWYMDQNTGRPYIRQLRNRNPGHQHIDLYGFVDHRLGLNLDHHGRCCNR
jgi:hypothetical protein